MKMLIDGELYDSETGELINELEQVEVEIVENNLPEIVCNGGTHIQTNTEQLKKELIVYLEKYDIEVTEETEKECSKKATELNKLAKDLNSKRLAVGKEIKKPADELKESIDSLIKIVQEKRTQLIEGVEVFKVKRFEIIRGLLYQRTQELYKEMNVSDRYQVVDIETLVKETSYGKSKLTKVANETLESMVRKVKALEDAVTIRTLQLEVTCKNKGLDFPIELKEVENFIEDDNYDEQLSNMIDSRISVQERVKEQAKKEAEEQEERLRLEKEKEAQIIEERRIAELEKEKQDKIQREEFRIAELARVEREKQEAIEAVKQQAIDKENKRLEEEKLKLEAEQRAIEQERIRAENERLALEKQQQETGTKIVTLEATFKIEVPLKIEDEKVRAKYEKQLKEMFTTLQNLTVR